MYALKAGVYALSVVDRAGGRAVDTAPAALESLALENAAKALVARSEVDAGAISAIGNIHWNFWRWSDAMSALESACTISARMTSTP